MLAIHSETSRAYCLVVMLLPEPGKRSAQLRSARCAAERALTVGVEVLYRHQRRLLIGADHERHGTRAIRIFADRLVGEHIACEVLQRKRLLFRAQLQNQPGIGNNCAKQLAMIIAEISSGRKGRGLRRGRL